MNCIRPTAACKIHSILRRFLTSCKCDGSDHECIITGIAIENQGCFIVVHGHGIIAQAAVDGHGLADTIGQEATGRFNGRQYIFHGDISIFSPLGAEDLTDLDGVISQTEVDCPHGSRIINRHRIISKEGIHDIALHAVVTTEVYPLYCAGLIQKCHEGDSLFDVGCLGIIFQVLVGANENRIVGIGRVDDEHILANGSVVPDFGHCIVLGAQEMNNETVTVLSTLNIIRTDASENNVRIVTALQNIIIGTTIEDVIARLTHDVIHATSAEKGVATITPIDCVVARIAKDCVGAGLAEYRIITRSSGNVIVSVIGTVCCVTCKAGRSRCISLSMDVIYAAATVNTVSSAATEEYIISVFTKYVILIGATVDTVVAGSAKDPIVASVSLQCIIAAKCAAVRFGYGPIVHDHAPAVTDKNVIIGAAVYIIVATAANQDIISTLAI